MFNWIVARGLDTERTAAVIMRIIVEVFQEEVDRYITFGDSKLTRILQYSLKKVVNEVHFIVAASENIFIGTLMRPWDVVTASNGKTIEVYVCTWQYKRAVSKALVDRIPDEKASTTTTLKLYYATSSIVHQLEACYKKVAEKEAFLEAHYKKVAGQKAVVAAAALLEKENTNAASIRPKCHAEERVFGTDYGTHNLLTGMS